MSDHRPRVVVCDIDGTIARRTKRGPYDMTRVGEDEPILFTVWLVQLISDAGVHIVFTSGRNVSAQLQTSMWLQQHVKIANYDLLMRKEGDDRPDHVIKEEMLEQLQTVYRIIGVFEDRSSVVGMWRARGLPCHQVAPGDF